MTTTGAGREMDILLQESQHVQDAISRVIGQTYTVFGLIIPSVFGLAIYLAEKTPTLPLVLLGVAVVGLVSLIVLFSASLWMEAFRYLRYKYVVLTPRMYKIAGLDAHENFLQYEARTRRLESWVPTILFQIIVFILAAGFGVYGFLARSELQISYKPLLAFLMFILLLFAATGLALTWRTGIENMRLLRKDAENVALGANAPET